MIFIVFFSLVSVFGEIPPIDSERTNINIFLLGDRLPVWVSSLLGITPEQSKKSDEIPFNKPILPVSVDNDGRMVIHHFENIPDEKLFDFFMDYPCGDEIKNNFRKSVNKMISHPKSEAVKVYKTFLSYIILNYYIHVESCYPDVRSFISSTYTNKFLYGCKKNITAKKGCATTQKNYGSPI